MPRNTTEYMAFTAAWKQNTSECVQGMKPASPGCSILGLPSTGALTFCASSTQVLTTLILDPDGLVMLEVLKLFKADRIPSQQS